MEIYIIERDERKFQALEDAFMWAENVVLVNDDLHHFLSNTYVQCVVSPANAFGLMDGGYDLALTQWYGDQLQKRAQQYIIDNFYGEQPVGTSFLIPAGKDDQYLIHTPTMQTPQRIQDPRVIYQCMRTTLMEAMKHNMESILIPMFGGSCGRVKPRIVAEMMYAAYRQLQDPPQKLDWDYAAEVELWPQQNFLDDGEE